ncbi:hypothetical protein [Crocosphaera sp. XPORK-15E]|uniref:hypothetical protein n=1 Tax=Crocosphaera sp. XPORK-15E TaxID=3110247 RepID=UPI002B1F1468|nr:hypothetical protein [Crocosphaera sp. XPORK-15E]MEA5536952.1 hypothetical protein [Crocosphaera sp. XPORK-15E]
MWSKMLTPRLRSVLAQSEVEGLTTRRITFCLDPTKQQEVKFYEWRKLHKLLYNTCSSHGIAKS